MTAERNTLPAWAGRERWNDLAWISSNLPNFWSAAILAYQELGRGAIVVETNYRVREGGHPAAYLTEEHISRYDDDIKCLVTDYTPEEELVVILIKEQQRTSAYRVRAGLPNSA